MMADYTCICPGPFGTARYTVKEASAKDFRCPICNTQIVEVKNTPVGAEHYTVFDDDDVQIAPGVNANDERFSDAVKEPEGLDMAKWDERHKERVRKNQETPSVIATENGHAFPNWITPENTPDVRIRYAHGIEYAFDYDGFDFDDANAVRHKILEWSDSWEHRKNALLVVAYHGRIYRLNAELVAGIDFKAV